MRKAIILILVLSLCPGCVNVWRGEGSLVERYNASKELEQAEEMLAKGETHSAAKTLNRTASGKRLSGVTDEALFRLALLALKPGAEKNGYSQGQHYLKRLSKEYPESPWTRLAAPVAELIETVEEQKRQNRSLKATNHALNKEIGELNKSIEQLKRLDLELERKAR